MATAWILQRMDAAAAWSSQHMTALRSDCEFDSWQSQSLFSHHFKHYSVISEVLPTETMRTKALEECLRLPQERHHIAWEVVLGGILVAGRRQADRSTRGPSTGLAWLRGWAVLPPEFLFPEPSKTAPKHGAGRPRCAPRMDKTRDRNRGRFLVAKLMPSCMLV